MLSIFRRKTNVLREAKYLSRLVNRYRETGKDLSDIENKRIDKFLKRTLNEKTIYQNGDEYLDCKIKDGEVVFFNVKKKKSQYSPYSEKDNDFIIEVQAMLSDYLEEIHFYDRKSIKFEVINYMILATLLMAIQMGCSIKIHANYYFLTTLTFLFITFKSLYIVNLNYNKINN